MKKPHRRFPRDSFRKKREPSLEFEVVGLGRLFRRRFRRPLDEPQRLGFYQVFCATRGEGLYTVDFTTHGFRAGDLVFAAPGQVQRFHPSPEVDGVMLVFTEGFFVQESSDQKLLGSSHVFAPWSIGRADAVREPLLRSRLRTILLQAERIKEDAVSLNRVTRIAAGLDAKDFIDARVMLELKRLLAHTDEGLKEIAAALGFDEPTNLVKYFRQRLHATPMEFRAAWRARGTFLP